MLRTSKWLIWSKRLASHPRGCLCQYCEHERRQQQHLTADPPMQGLEDSAVSVRELFDYKVLDDWSDD